MRVLICRSNPVAPDPRVEKEALSLQKAGYTVQVLGWDRNGNIPAKQELEGISIRRLLIRAGYGRGIMNFFPLLLWQVGLLGWLFRHRREYDLIHACDFDTILPALACKKLFGKQVVYDIFDFYADHLRATPVWIKRLIRAVDLWAVDRADAVIVVDEARFGQIAGSHPKHLAAIYNSPADTLASVSIKENSSSAELRLAYIGLLQVERGLIDMLEVLSHHPEWSLDLAGFGGDEAQILAAAQSQPNITWHGRIPYQTAIELSAQADALFALYDPQIPNHRFSSPNKLFEAMMLGKPIIVAQDTNMDQIVKKVNCGLVIEYHNNQQLENALVRLATDRELRRKLGENARRAYDGEYGWKVMEQRLQTLYSVVLLEHQK